jgi:hypothetical protein
MHGRGGRRPRQPHRGHARARQPPDRHRQRPRHPGRPAPQISRQVGARSDHDHAPLGRQVRGQGLFDQRRPPRRRGQRRQRAVDRDHRRGRARQEALPPDLLARPRHLAARGSRRRPQPPRHHRQLHPRPRDLRRRRRFDPERLYKLARSKAYLFAGVEIRWRCDPSLASADVPETAVFQFPGGLADHLAEQLGDRECVTNQPFAGRQDFPDDQGRPNGRSPGRSMERRQRKLLLQHHPDPRRRHPRGGPARRADQGHPRVRRAGRQQARQGHHRRRRVQRRRADAQRVHPQPAFPEPDQGPPDQPRGGALRRGRGARPFRPLSRRQYGPRPRAARRDRRADGRAPQAPRRARGQAQDRHLRAQAPPPRQAHRLRQ